MKIAAASAVAPSFLNILVRSGRAADVPPGMNLVVFLTSRERALRNFPKGWAAENLPGMSLIRRHGLAFHRAFCAATTSSPSRASLLTGLFPAQHQVTGTLTFGTAGSDFEQALPLNISNLAHVMAAAGYEVAYKGKWDLSKPLGRPRTLDEVEKAWRPADVGVYGFGRWNPPDAGLSLAPSQLGGGRGNNDFRILHGAGAASAGEEGVLEYLQDPARGRQPFCLVVSLANPGDVLAYPGSCRTSGYDQPGWFRGDIDLPASWDESLLTKPSAQREALGKIRRIFGDLSTRGERREYLNFYGNLLRRADEYLFAVVGVLRRSRLLDNTLIVRTADHGEMALSHGGLRGSFCNAYEETLRVPLIFSNPRLFPQARESEALVSHVDLLPSLAALFDAPVPPDCAGVDYSGILRDPASPAPGEEVLFTSDDVRCGQDADPFVAPPNRLCGVREGRYKLVKYFDEEGGMPDEWEMYDLQNDPGETHNLAHPGHRPAAEESSERTRLTALLERLQESRLQPLKTPLAPSPQPAW